MNYCRVFAVAGHQLWNSLTTRTGLSPLVVHKAHMHKGPTSTLIYHSPSPGTPEFLFPERVYGLGSVAPCINPGLFPAN